MRLSTLAAFLTIAAALVFVAPAAAANVAPNPGFEDACGHPTQPCAWSADRGIVYRDTAAHSGQASLNVTVDPTSGPDAEARSVCITGLSAGAHDASFWYFTDFWGGQELALHVTFYSGACSGTPPSNTATVVPDTFWQQNSAVFTAPPGTQSAKVAFVLSCPIPPCFPDFFEANVDDVVLAPQQPTAVRASSFTARRSRGGVGLKWRTSSEVEVLGFHVYREDGDRRLRLTRSLLPSRFAGSARGHSYSFLDRTAPGSTARYWLQLVSPTGTLRWQGPIRA